MRRWTQGLETDGPSYARSVRAVMDPDDNGAFVLHKDAAKLLADRDAEIERLRAKLDSEANHRLSLCADNERFVAEIERLRADLVWAVNSGAFMSSHRTRLIAWDGDTFNDLADCDGTPESICRAVRSARTGE